MNDGRVIVTERQTRRLIRVQMDGKKDVVAEVGGSTNGAAIGPDGMMYVYNGGGLKMVEVERKLTPAPETWRMITRVAVFSVWISPVAQSKLCIPSVTAVNSVTQTIACSMRLEDFSSPTLVR